MPRQEAEHQTSHQGACDVFRHRKIYVDTVVRADVWRCTRWVASGIIDEDSSAEPLIGPAPVDAYVTQNMGADIPFQRLDKIESQYGLLVIVRGLARNANELKAECKPYQGQREYGRFHGSYQQQKL